MPSVPPPASTSDAAARAWRAPPPRRPGGGGGGAGGAPRRAAAPQRDLAGGAEQPPSQPVLEVFGLRDEGHGVGTGQGEEDRVHERAVVGGQDDALALRHVV